MAAALLPTTSLLGSALLLLRVLSTLLLPGVLLLSRLVLAGVLTLLAALTLFALLSHRWSPLGVPAIYVRGIGLSMNTLPAVTPGCLTLTFR